MFSFLFRSLIFNAFIDLYCTLQLLLLHSNAQHDNNEGRFVLMQMCVARTFITDNKKMFNSLQTFSTIRIFSRLRVCISCILMYKYTT